MSKWKTAQEHEAEYFISGKNKQWGTPHSLKYWIDFLWLDEIQAEDRGLEVGCGPNGMWRFAKNVTGLDPLDYSHLSGNFIQAKAEKIPFPDSEFDFVVCCNALDHMENPKRAMKEIIRVTRPSGIIVLWTNIFPLWLSKIFSKLDSTHPYHFTLEDFYQQIPASLWFLKSRYVDFSESHLKYAKTLNAKSKLIIAELCQVHGLNTHWIVNK